MKLARLVVALIVGVGSLVGFDAGGQDAAASSTSQEVVQALGGRPSAPAGIPHEDWAALRQRVRDSLYQVRQSGDGEGAQYEAANPAQGFRVRFSAAGFTVVARDSQGEQWGLELVGYGYGDGLRAVQPVEPEVNGNRVEYRRGPLVEWYVNDERGLEQGFTLWERPGSERTGLEPQPGGRQRPLVLSLRGRGTLRANAEGLAEIPLANEAGEVVLNYGGLVAWDARGRELAAKMSVVAGSVRIEVDDSAAVYPVTVDPTIQSTKIQASDAVGISTAISGDTAIISGGAAYIFERNEGGVNNWGEVKKLQSLDGLAGGSVAISGDTAVVGGGGGKGAVYLFERNEGGANNWGETAMIEASDPENFDFFGSPAISGDTVIAGSVLQEEGGAAYLFERNEGGANNWGEVKKILPSDLPPESDACCGSVAISGDTVILGAHLANRDVGPFAAGAAYIFERDHPVADNWGQTARIQASDLEEHALFGLSVAISGDTVIVGSRHDILDSGAAYLFERNEGGANNWGETAKIRGSDTKAGDFFGDTLAIFGDMAIVGALQETTGGIDTGAAYLFERNQGPDNWGEVAKIQAADKAAGDVFGFSLAISGDTAIVGAPGSGAAYVVDLSSVTPDGTGVPVDPVDTTTGESPVSLTFDVVDVSGTTTLTTSESGPSPPSGFRVEGAFYFDLSTTAEFLGSVTVCVDYSGISSFTMLTVTEQENLKIFHFEDEPEPWVDVTVQPVDTASQVICARVMSFSLFAVFAEEEEVLQVAIDIKPNEFPNTINLGSNGTVAVAIFSTTEFDARTVEPTSVTLAGATVQLRGQGKPQASFQDVNLDGLLDLVVHVDTRTFEVSPGDTVAILRGETTGGLKIIGSDSIRIVPQ